jgi:hypothetical protein
MKMNKEVPMSTQTVGLVMQLLSKSRNVDSLSKWLSRIGIGSYAECYELVNEAIELDRHDACESNGGDCFFCKLISSCPKSERKEA